MKIIIYFQQNLVKKTLTLLGGGFGNLRITQSSTTRTTTLLDNNTNAPLSSSTSRTSTSRGSKKNIKSYAVIWYMDQYLIENVRAVVSQLVLIIGKRPY